MRLIDADALKLDIMCVYGSNPQYINWLNHAPTVDAVPVIRCKDCKYYEEQDETIGTCLLTESGAHIKGYCSWAEWSEE